MQNFFLKYKYFSSERKIEKSNKQIALRSIRQSIVIRKKKVKKKFREDEEAVCFLKI